jgi:hypothetical protein
MWLFGKRRAEAIKREAEALVRKILEDETTRFNLETSNALGSNIKTELLKMNEQIMGAFAAAQRTGDTNTESIAILAQSINYLSQVYTALDGRISVLENQLSVSGVTFTKGTTN